MTTTLKITLMVLAVAALACGGTIRIPQVPTAGPTTVDEINVPAPTSGQTRLTLSFGAGELKLTPGAADLVEGTASYNLDDLKPQVITDGSNVEIKQEDLLTLVEPSGVKSVWDFKLGSSPMDLSINAKNFAVTKIDYACLREVQGGEVRYRMMETPAIVRMFHRSGIGIDLFVHFYDGDVAWHGSSIHRWDNQRFELIDYEFLGRSFKGARDFDRYLSENYGADWRIPKTDFDTDLDTPNMSFVGSANALVFFAWMLARAVAEQQPQRVRKYIRMLESLAVIEVQEGGIAVR